MKKSRHSKLHFWMAVAVLLSVLVFTVLMRYNAKISDTAAKNMGELYLSEIMYQVQDHFQTLVDVKSKEAMHIAEWAKTMKESEHYEVIAEAAESMDFEYVTLYDSEGNYETILGESAWYRNLDQYISRVLAGEKIATTGYLTRTGGKYLVFGSPAQFEMESGKISEVMLIGFSIDKLYEYINLEYTENLDSNARMWVVLRNGSYILSSTEIETTSFFEHMGMVESFSDRSIEEGTSLIENSMAKGDTFFAMITHLGKERNIYGAPAQEPSDWYFVLSMPKGVSENMVFDQNAELVRAFFMGGAVILMLFFAVFIFYLRLSDQQIKETEIARREAENANRAKSVFLSNMSHDIRTPMNAILGFTNLAIKEEDRSVIGKYLEKISTASNHLLLLINEVLEMSRIESGKVVLSEAPTSLEDLFDDLQTVMEKKAEGKGHEFLIEMQLDEKYVYCDGLRLSQVVMNLASNAIKYTPEGGKIRVGVKQLSGEKTGYGRYEITVTDNGIGMSKNFMEHIFEPFERENNSTVSGIEGTGLGLSIVKHIVDMMHGNIEVCSESGQGSTFTVTLMLRILEPELAAELESQKDKQVEEEASGREQMLKFFTGKRILLVEDNEFNREIAGSMLEEAGFLVETAENGKIAVQKISEAAPGYYDTVLMDVQMPVMNGYDATKEIRRLGDERAGVYIIAVTANAFETDRRNALEAGMDDYVSKPIEVEKLYEALKRQAK